MLSRTWLPIGAADHPGVMAALARAFQLAPFKVLESMKSRVIQIITSAPARVGNFSGSLLKIGAASTSRRYAWNGNLHPLLNDDYLKNKIMMIWNIWVGQSSKHFEKRCLRSTCLEQESLAPPPAAAAAPGGAGICVNMLRTYPFL